MNPSSSHLNGVPENDAVWHEADLERRAEAGVDPDDHDDVWAYVSACKGEPYTADEWDAHVTHLRAQLADAEDRWREAKRCGSCLAARFEQ